MWALWGRKSEEVREQNRVGGIIKSMKELDAKIEKAKKKTRP